MKKIYSFLLLSTLLLLGAQSAWGYTVTISVKAQEKYLLYAWDGNKATLNGAWDSENDIASGPVDGVYTYSFEATNNTTLSIIFRNTDRTVQTIDIECGTIDENKSFSYDLSEGLSVWSLKGSFDGWANHYTSKRFTIVNLPADNTTYEFGVTNQSGQWRAAGKDWSGYTMTKDNTATGWWNFAENGDMKNLQVNSTISGDYTFVFDGDKAGTFIYPVQLNADGYASFYSTMEVDVPDGVNAYYQSSNTLEGTSVTVYFTKLTGGKIPANTPVILKGVANAKLSFAYSNTSASVTNDDMFKGVNTTKEYASLDGISDGDYVYVLAGTGANFGFHQLASTGHVNACRCYLVVPAANGPATAPAINMWIEDENGATPIQVFNAEENVKDDAIYTVLGQKVESMSAPGIYIQAGKKFIIK